MMQFVYQRERIKALKEDLLMVKETKIIDLNEEGTKRLAKLERKHKNKLEGRK